jgi:hypothetical protein
MYEMQGPCPVFGRWPCRLPGWLAVTRPAAGTRRPPEVPVSRFFLRSGVAPGVVPVSGSDVFLLPPPGLAQGLRAVISRLFSRPQRIHSQVRVVPRARHFSTGLSTTSPQPASQPASPAAVNHRRAALAPGRGRIWTRPPGPGECASRPAAGGACWPALAASPARPSRRAWRVRAVLPRRFRRPRSGSRSRPPRESSPPDRPGPASTIGWSRPGPRSRPRGVPRRLPS